MSISGVQTVESATSIDDHANPVGTSGSTLVNAFGQNHSAIASATLTTSLTYASLHQSVYELIKIRTKDFCSKHIEGKKASSRQGGTVLSCHDAGSQYQLQRFIIVAEPRLLSYLSKRYAMERTSVYNGGDHE